jgi:hypothetical protein
LAHPDASTLGLTRSPSIRRTDRNDTRVGWRYCYLACAYLEQLNDCPLFKSNIRVRRYGQSRFACVVNLYTLVHVGQDEGITISLVVPQDKAVPAITLARRISVIGQIAVMILAVLQPDVWMSSDGQFH